MSGYGFLQLATNHFVARNPQKAHYLDQHNRVEHISHLTRIVGNGSQLTPVGNSLGSSSCVPPPSCSSGNCCYPNGYGLWNCTCNTGGGCSKMSNGQWLCTFTS